MGCRTSKPSVPPPEDPLEPLGRREGSKIQWFYRIRERQFYSQHENQPFPLPTDIEIVDPYERTYALSSLCELLKRVGLWETWTRPHREPEVLVPLGCRKGSPIHWFVHREENMFYTQYAGQPRPVPTWLDIVEPNERTYALMALAFAEGGYKMQLIARNPNWVPPPPPIPLLTRDDTSEE
jgi:hypothetical protein